MPASRNKTVLRKRKIVTSPEGTQWVTSSGGLFIEPVQRPDAHQGEQVQLMLQLSSADYRLLEVLHDDVASYISRLVRSHCAGMIKSAEHNKKVKDASSKNTEVAG